MSEPGPVPDRRRSGPSFPLAPLPLSCCEQSPSFLEEGGGGWKEEGEALGGEPEDHRAISITSLETAPVSQRRDGDGGAEGRGQGSRRQDVAAGGREAESGSQG